MSASDDYPHILFVTSAAFNKVTGGGITFSNLFRDWPAEKLTTVHNDPFPVTFDVCRSYFRLGPGEIGRWPRLLAREPGRELVESDAEAVPDGKSGFPGFVQTLKKAVVGEPWPDIGRLTPELEAFIAKRRPDVIYTILGTNGMCELVRAIRDKYKLPTVLHFMDDYFSTLYRGGLLSPVVRGHMAALHRDLLQKASERVAIGDDMAEAYRKRWNVPFHAIQNAVDISNVPVSDVVRDPARDVRLAYIGSIFPYAQSDSLVDIAQAVATLAGQGRKISLDIYSPAHLAAPYRERLEISPAVRLCSAITDDAAFFGKLAEADALILPVNFDARTIDYIRYSMPTKLPAYLASGTPILVYGPSQVSQVSYAEREGWGLVMNRPDQQSLEAVILRIATDNVLRATLSAQARRVAANHDARHVRKQFQDILMNAAQGRK